MPSFLPNGRASRRILFPFVALALLAAPDLPAAAATTYVLTVKSAAPASGVVVSANPADNGKKTSGTTTFTLTYNSGTTVVLTAPAKSGTSVFSSWTGCASAATVACTVKMTANTTVTATYAPPKVTPAMALTLSAAAVTSLQPLTVKIALTAPTGDAAPAGTVTLASGKYTSAATALVNASATIAIPKGSLALGTDTLTASYTPSAAQSALYNGASAKTSVKVTAIAPVATVALSSASITSLQPLTVTVSVAAPAGDPVPAGTVKLTSGTYATAPGSLVDGVGKFNLPANALPAGTDSLKAVYTPSSAQAETYASVSATAPVKVVSVPKLTPTLSVATSATDFGSQQPLTVKTIVTVPAGDAAPAGTVTLTSGSYSSAATPVENGAVKLVIPAGALAAGTDQVTATFTPTGASAALYNTATAASANLTIFAQTAVTVNLSSLGPVVTDKLLGMNMAYWYPQSTSQIVAAFQTAGIKAIRWPGGSGSDVYHWENNSICNNGYTVPDASFPSPLVSELWAPGNLDVAVTANYGTNPTCTGPGEPSEAAAWVASSLKNGNYVSHWTVGNEVYGSWETDMHAKPNDAATYANAVATGYYPQMKAANPNTLVGVVVQPNNNPPWDPIVMAKAKYDFVEYHYYPQGPGQESDTYLVQQAAQGLTANLNAIKADLAQYGKADTPIYVGEIGSVYTDPGKQSSSITQALYAGQVLGEMMNAGVSRATWWIGFGGCSDASSGNFSSSLYGWQNFGGYMVFSDGLPEGGCYGAPTVPAGTLLPTARAFQLFSAIAVSGENVLTATVAGDTTDVRAYAATSAGGTALLLFNDNETASQQVLVSLTGQTAASSVTVETYDKAIYDQSKNNVWAPPTTKSLGAQTLPLSLTLTPWSMNVVIVK